jgi:hypothetical protein
MPTFPLRLLALTLASLALLVSAPAFPCGSNCYVCHYRVPNDSNHRVIKSCVKCHSNHSDKGMGSCGQDCFQCHDYKKVMKLSKEHRVLKKCVACHSKLKRGSVPNYLKEFLGGDY